MNIYISTNSKLKKETKKKKKAVIIRRPANYQAPPTPILAKIWARGPQDVVSFDLTPIITCAKNVPCKKQGYCQLPIRMNFINTLASWERNTKAVKSGLWKNELIDYLAYYKPEFFRIHAYGDFLSQNYVNDWFEIARMFPLINFLAFTKQFSFNYTKRPENFTVVFSFWHDWGLTEFADNQKVNKVFVYDWRNPDNRIDNNTIFCPGHCASCLLCWNADTIQNTIAFQKH